MKRYLAIVGGVLVAVVLVVLFVPGVRELIEAKVLTWLARSAS